jgi:flavin-dependent dehydrogenase
MTHAVVLGAGMAGLLTARVLSEFYEHVTVVERDRLPDSPIQRKGIPQGRHLHSFLSRGCHRSRNSFPESAMNSSMRVPMSSTTETCPASTRASGPMR